MAIRTYEDGALSVRLDSGTLSVADNGKQTVSIYSELNGAKIDSVDFGLIFLPNDVLSAIATYCVQSGIRIYPLSPLKIG